MAEEIALEVTIIEFTAEELAMLEKLFTIEEMTVIFGCQVFEIPAEYFETDLNVQGIKL